MFCPNCGKELPQGTEICDCGTALHLSQDAPDNQDNQQSVAGPSEPPTEYLPTGSNQEKPRKKGILLKGIAIFLIAVILLSGITVLGYFTFLPAKPTFWTAQYLTLQKSYKQMEKTLERNQQMTDALYATPMKSDTRVNLILDSNLLAALGADPSMAGMITNVVNDLTLLVNAEVDMPNKKENFGMSLNYLNNPMLSLNGFLDNDRMGISLPELSQKNLVGRFKDLSRFAELYPEEPSLSGLSSLSGMDPWLSSSLRHEIVIENKDIKKLMETYGMLFVNSLDSGDMSIKRSIPTEIFGETEKCQEVTITLDKKAQMDLVVSLLDTMRRDDTLYDAVFGNMIRIFEIMAESNPAFSQSMQGMDMKSVFGKPQIRLLLSTLKNSLNKDMFLEEMVVRAYIKGLDVVKYELEIPMPTAGDSILLSFESLMDGDSSKTRVTANVKAVGDSVVACFDMDRQYDEKNNTQDLMATFDAEFGSTAGNMHFKLNATEDPDGSNGIKGQVDLSLSYDLSGNSIAPASGSFGILADTNRTMNRDGLPVNIDVTADVALNIPAITPEPLGFSMAFESDMEYGVSVEAPAWSQTNVIDLATASREDLDAYTQEIANTIDSIMELLSYLY